MKQLGDEHDNSEDMKDVADRLVLDSVLEVAGKMSLGDAAKEAAKCPHKETLLAMNKEIQNLKKTVERLNKQIAEKKDCCQTCPETAKKK